MNFLHSHIKQFRILLVIGVVVISNHIPTIALAHPFGYSTITTYLESHGSTFTFHTEVPQSVPANASIETDKLALYTSYFSGNFLIKQSEHTCVLVVSEATTTDAITTWDGTITCPKTITTLSELTITNTLFADLFETSDHFLTIKINHSGGYDAWDLVFNTNYQTYPNGVVATPTDTPTIKHPEAQSQSKTKASSTSSSSEKAAPVSVATSTTPLTSIRDNLRDISSHIFTLYDQLEIFWSRITTIAHTFVWLGMIHIWSGYDHILFLVSLILLLRSYRKIFTIVTAFTVAHSLTLILSSLHIITIPQKIVSPLVALSIVYMAVCNIAQLRKDEDADLLPNHWWFTAGFGLIHGLGFASALLDANIPSNFFIPSLIMFNVGIEIGQLVWLAVTIPLLLQIDEFTDRRTILLYISILTLILAFCWFFLGILS